MTIVAPPRVELGSILAEHEPISHALSRFVRKIDERDGHWFWRGATFKPNEYNHEYGYFHFRHTMYYAHRWAYEAFVGPIPEGYTIDHLCRVTQCVRPDHLEPVPHLVNVQRGNGQTHTPLKVVKPGCCKHGHPWTVESTYLHPSGRTHCRLCQRARARNGKAS